VRKLTANLFMSLDGVVEAPNTFMRPELYDDIPEEYIAEQDAVLMGRKIYEEWAQFWPDSNIEPFASFINNHPKFVVSSTLRKLEWRNSTLLDGGLEEAIRKLKAQPGKTVGVHGISLIQSLLQAGLIDELHVTLVPAIAGRGRRLLDHQGAAIQLDLLNSHATPGGLQCLVYTVKR
jgi:dihydrofolate reductase